MLFVFTLLPSLFCGQSLSLRNFDPRAGLSSSETYHAIQDRLGYIWIASDAGVNRFDGKDFRKFNREDGLPDNTIFNMLEDHHGRIWFLSYSGAISYFFNDSIYNIGANDTLRKLINYQNEVFVSFEVDQGDTLWISQNYRNYFIKIPPAKHYKNIELVRADECERNFIFRKGSPIPLYTSQEAFSKDGCTRVLFPDTSFTFPLEQNNPAVATYVKLVVPGKREFIFSIFNMLYHFSGDRITESRRFPERIIALSLDRSSNLWVGVYKHGVRRFSGTSILGESTHFFGNKSVTHVLQDHENGMWFTTLEQGLFYTASSEILHLDIPDPDQLVTTLQNFSGELFAGTVTRKMYRLIQVKSKNKFMLAYYGSVYAGSDTSASRSGLYPSGSALQNFDLLGRKRRESFGGQTSEGAPGRNIEIYTTLYTLFYKDRKGKLVRHIEFPARINYIHKHHSGTLYVGCMNGLWKIADNKPHYLGDDNPSLRFPVTSILTDNNGWLWVSTKGGGVTRIEGNKTTVFNKTLSGINNHCTALCADENGMIWIGTNTGLFRLDPDRETVQKFDSSHGLKTNEIKAIGTFSGHLFVATPLGIDYFPLSNNLWNSTPPPVSIYKVTAGGTPLKTGETGSVLPYYRNNLEFSFIGFTYKSGHQKQYSYKLEGFDNSWHSTTNENALYTNLSPGSYTFMVSLANNNGVASSEPVSISFRINIPWWRSTTATVTGLLFILSFLAISGYLLAKTVRRRQERKAQMDQLLIESKLTALRSQMNPHFIFNVINSIQHFILFNNKDQAYDYLARFSKLIRMVLDNSRNTTVTLENEIDLLNLYVDLEKLRFENEFEFKLHVRAQQPVKNLLIPNMLIQPYLENAIIHGLGPKKGKGCIELEFIQNNNLLNVTLTDNGIGRAASRLQRNSVVRKNHRSSGMFLAEERLKMMSKFVKNEIKVKISDLVDAEGNPAGTRVELDIPLM